MIRFFARLTLVGLAGAWLADRALGRRAAGGLPAPLSSLAVVDAPIERVWELVADIPAQPDWMHEMKSVRLTTPPPTGVGTRGEATVRIFGISVTDPVEVTAFEPPVRFEIRHEGTFTGHGSITLEPGADGSTTIVRWDETLVAPILPHLGAVVMAPILSSIFQADLLRFRDLVVGRS